MMCRYILFLVMSSALVFPSRAIGRETIITYLSWYPSYGTLVGCDKWREGGAGYSKRAAQGINRPIVDEGGRAFEYSSPITYALSVNGGEYIKSELSQIKAAGFDVVAYDTLPSPLPKRSSFSSPAYCGLDQFNRFGEIADGLGLKVAIFSDSKNLSADFPNEYVFRSSEWSSAYSIIAKYYGNMSWYWKPLGRPALFQFAASVGAMKDSKGANAIREWVSVVNGLSETKNPLDVFLDVRPNDYLALEVSSGNGGAMPFLFAPGAPSAFVNQFLTDLSKRTSYPIWSVSPGYYNRRLHAYLPPDFSRIHNAYTSALKNNASAMLVATWNDFEEDTDIVPSVNKGKALLKVFEYYNTWFKSGKPPVLQKSTIVVAIPSYRFGLLKSAQPSWGGGAVDAISNPYGQVVYYWSYMKSDGWIVINNKKVAFRKGLNIGKENVGYVSSVNINTSFGEQSAAKIENIDVESDKNSDPGMTFIYLMLEGK